MNHNSDLQNPSTESTPKVPDASRVIIIMPVSISGIIRHETIDQYLSGENNLRKKDNLSTENDPFENLEKMHLISVYFEGFLQYREPPNVRQ